MIKIDDFFKNFSLSEFVLEHLKDTEESFKEYITELFKHKQSTIEWFLYDYLVKEVNSSYKIENKLYDEAMIKLYDEDMLGTEITEDMLKSVNLLCRNNDELMNEDEFYELMRKRKLSFTYKDYLLDLKNNPPGKYRKKNIWLGNPGEGIEYAFHIPPDYQELDEYMKDFINFVNNNQFNTFIGCALIHLFFIKIHPFSDGNGRTARILMNDYIKRGVEKKYSIVTKYPIINLSISLNISKLNYINKQNDIKFSNDVDNNEAINKWVDFILNMFDEQIYYLKNRLLKYDEVLDRMDNMKKYF